MKFCMKLCEIIELVTNADFPNHNFHYYLFISCFFFLILFAFRVQDEAELQEL